MKAEMDVVLTWLLLATGFTGGLTLVFVIRWVHRWWYQPLTVAVHFSPKGGCTEAVVHELRHARHEILVQAYSFTSRPIAEALVAAQKRGVQVEILLDHSNEAEMYTQLDEVMAEGLIPLVDSHHAIAHNKIMIVDRHTLITGSFNFTHQAEIENAENLLIIKHHPELTESYRKNFLDHQSHCKKPNLKAQPHDKRKAA